jgi:hypothetical protein
MSKGKNNGLDDLLDSLPKVDVDSLPKTDVDALLDSLPKTDVDALLDELPVLPFGEVKPASHPKKAQR